jgi:hypothetical protein
MRPPTTRTRRLLAGALLVGLAARLAFALGYWQDKPLTHDEQEYLALGLNLAAGRGFVRDLPGVPTTTSAESFSRAPLYPMWLAALFRVTHFPTDHVPPAVPRVVQVAQAFLGVVVIWLVSRFTARAAGPGAGAVAAWLAALYPPLVWCGAYALSEAVYAPLVLSSAAVAGLVTDRRNPAREPHEGRHLLVAGMLAGLAALTRSAALAFLPLLAGLLCVQRRWRLAVVLALGAGTIVLPWTLRNLAIHDRLVLVAADGGVNFWIGNHPLAIGEGDLAANPAIKQAHVGFRTALQHLSPEQREPYYFDAAVRAITEHPGRWLVLLARKAFYTWVPVGPSYTLHSAVYYWATVLTYLPLLFLACGGVPALAASPKPPLALGVLLASYVLLCLVTFPHERYRIPVVDPSLCVAAALPLARRSGVA